MAPKLILLAATLQVIFIFSSNAQECEAPGVTDGKCVPYWECASVMDVLNRGARRMGDTSRLQNRICKTRQGHHGFCCENTDITMGLLKESSQSIETNPWDCGRTVLRPTIVGGSLAHPNSWPWIARVGKVDKATGEIAWGCGGSLITRKHVITAAHCVMTMNSDGSRSPHGQMYVSLGELDITKMNESVTVDIPVKAKILHEAYKQTPLRNDIAILELEKEAPSIRSISPVCLPFGNEISQESLSGKNVMVAGWGITGNGETSSALMEVELQVWHEDECMQTYRRYLSAGMDKTKICAGGRYDAGQDACGGDSGGPLVYRIRSGGRRSRLYLFGVVSAGTKNGCATAEFPGIYTRVTSYQKWIKDVVNGISGVGKIITT